MKQFQDAQNQLSGALGTRGRIEFEIPFNVPPDRPVGLLSDLQVPALSGEQLVANALAANLFRRGVRRRAHDHARWARGS